MRRLLLLVLFLASCGDPPAAPAPTGPPQRIVSTLPGITEMVCYLGACDRLVAVSPYCDYPPEVATLPRIKVHPFDVEAVLRLQPDLVIVDERLHRQDLAIIRKRVPDLLVLDTSRSLQSVSASMDRVADALGDQEAKHLAERRFKVNMLQTSLEVVSRQGSHAPRVLIVGQWDPLYAMGKGSLLDDLVRKCGGTNIAWDLEGDASNTFSEELVLERRPDWILTPRTPMPDRIRDRWKDVPAVKHGRIIDGSGDDLVRAGPRILDGLRRLSKRLREPIK